MSESNGNGKAKFWEAFIKAKANFKPLVKNKTNPHYKSEYADLAAVHESVDDALAACGFTVVQPLVCNDKGDLSIHTRLVHVGGHEETSTYPLPGGVKQQEMGSAITYGCRYSLQALLGIAPIEGDDDDGTEASKETERRPAPSPAPQKKPEDVKPEAKKGFGWEGIITTCDPHSPGLWKATGKDKTGAEETFAITNPDHAVVAQTARDGMNRVSLFYHLNKNKTKMIDGIEPKEQE